MTISYFSKKQFWFTISGVALALIIAGVFIILPSVPSTLPPQQPIIITADLDTEPSADHVPNNINSPDLDEGDFDEGDKDISESPVPISRPDLYDILPIATGNINQMVARETGGAISNTHTLTLSSGDTLGGLLHKAKISQRDIAALSEILSEQIDLRRLQIGTQFTIALDENGKADAIQIHLPTRIPEQILGTNAFLDYYVIRQHDENNLNRDSWQVIRAIRPLDITPVETTGKISLSLYQSAEEANIPLNILDQFVRVMGFSVDFQREIRQGDSFDLIYEKSVDRLTGEVLATGALRYASMTLSGKKLAFYYYHSDSPDKTDELSGWYDEDGGSAVRTLMRTPVNGARLSSGYGVRQHPITGFNALHKGVDFAAPAGTPILAAGSGKIERAGWNGGYGRYIRIRHNGTYKTAYAHLRSIAPHIKAGVNVKQGEIIGTVGSSGHSTGPHLHYEILVNGHRVNPLTVKLPIHKSLPPEFMDDFRQQIHQINPERMTNKQVANNHRAIMPKTLP